MSNDDNKKLSQQDIRFVRALRVELNRQAVEYQAKKSGTVDAQMFIGQEPLLYKFFDLDE